MQITDLELVFGSNQRKGLHTTWSTTFIDVDDEILSRIVPKEIKLLDSRQATLEGNVKSICNSSLPVKHSCTKWTTFDEIDSGFYCCPSCNMMGIMESVATSKPKISFCFEDIENKKHNFQVDASILENFTCHKVLNKVKLAKLLCKMPWFFC